MPASRRIEEIISDLTPAVTAFTRSMVRDLSLVDDIVQETFIRVWRYLPTYREEGSFEGWAIRICHNVIRTTMRKRSTSEPLAADVAQRSDDYGATDLRLLVHELTEDHRAVAVLCLILGFPYEEAASILDIPVGTVRSRVFRARAVLKSTLERAPEERRHA